MAFNSGLGVAPALDKDPGAIFWRHPKLATEVVVQSSPATSIPEQALAGLAANPPFEISGLLLGSLVQNDLYRTLLVADAVCLSEKGSGQLSQRLEFEAFVAAAKQYNPAGQSQVIGYFRSHLRDNFTITDEDLEIMRQCFPDGECVSLLIRPANTGSCLARFFVAENGHVQAETPQRDVSLATPPSTPSLQAPTPSPFLVRGIPSGSLAIPEPRSASLFNKKYLRTLSLAVCVASVVAGGLALYVNSQSRRSGQATGDGKNAHSSSEPTPGAANANNNVPALLTAELGLGLQVTRPVAGELDVAWNRSLLADATGGQLHITEGAIHRNLALDRAQLHEGKLTYFPRNPDVLFKLDVDLPEGRSVTESIRVVGSEVVRASNNIPAPIAKEPVAVKSPPTAKTDLLAMGAVPVRRKPLASPDTGSAATPIIENTQALASAPAEILGGNLNLPPMPEPNAKGGSSQSLDAMVPEMATPSRQYVAPKPLRQAMPNIRSIMPAGVLGLITVEITAQVDKNGNVTEAHTRTPANVLTNECIAAARGWTFTPATRNGQNVDSTYIMKFVFKPQHAH